MVKPYKIYKDFTGITVPARLEGEIPDLIVDGEIPKEIDGTFYRVGHDPYYDPDYFQNGAKSTPFDGDGVVAAFRFKDGIVSFKQRYVYTEKLVAERKAGRAMFGILTASFTHHPCVQSLISSPANTNVILHNGKLLALMEAGPPFEMDPNTLATKGHEPFKGQIPARQPFTAHPKVDPTTGDLIGFGYNLNGIMSTDFVVWAIDKNGKKKWERKGNAPHSGFIHDMAMTPNYVVLMMMPLVTDLSDVYTKHATFYDRELPAYMVVVPRNAPSEPIRSFSWNNCLNIHSGCTWEEDGKIKFDSTRAHDNVFSFLPYKDAPIDEKPKQMVVDYVKWTIDPKASSDVLEDPEVLISLPCEFPRTDERILGQKAKITFLACFKQPDDGKKVVYQGLNALARFNHETRKMDILDPGNCLVQEPNFIPRSPDAPEGDGYIVVMIDNLDEHRNELLFIDTKDFTKIQARIQLPLRKSKLLSDLSIAGSCVRLL
ncbi:putative cartenoid oxygenase [Leptodontidium sp. 2 PMI_412]|nr:putative cartenoid oxygenase [Leptodontidium sp. 2 PMI_412]